MSRLVKALQEASGVSRNKDAVDDADDGIADSDYSVDDGVYDDNASNLALSLDENFIDHIETQSDLSLQGKEFNNEPRLEDRVATDNSIVEVEFDESIEDLYRDVTRHKAGDQGVATGEQVDVENGANDLKGNSEELVDGGLINDKEEGSSSAGNESVDSSSVGLQDPLDSEFDNHLQSYIEETLAEGRHSEEYSDTSHSIAVMFAEHGKSKRAHRNWLNYGVAVTVIALLTGGLWFEWQPSSNSSYTVNSAVELDDDFASDGASFVEYTLTETLPTEPAQQALTFEEAERVRLSQSAASDIAEGYAEDAEPASSEASQKVSGVSFVKQRKAPEVAATLNSAYENFKLQHYEEALALYRQAMATDENSIDANLGVGSVLFELKDYQSALRYFERVLASDSFNILAISKKAEILKLQNKDYQDPGFLPVSGEYFSEDASNYFYLGQVHASNGEWKKAQEAFFQAHSMDKDNDLYAYNLAVSLDQLQKRTLALPYYEKVLAGKAIATLDYKKIANRVNSIVSSK